MLKISSRLRPLFVGAFLQSFVPWYAIITPFLVNIGLNKSQIALIMIIFSAVFLIANIPFGILGDRWSRKGVLIIGSFFLLLTSLVAGISQDFWEYALAACLSALTFSCTSGTYDSVIYDTVVEETGNDELYERYYGRLIFIQGIALSLSSLLGGIAASLFNFRVAYFLTIPVAIISVLPLLAFREPHLHKKLIVEALRAHLVETFKTVLQKGIVLKIILSLVMVEIGILIMSQLDQLWLVSLSLPIALYGPVNAVLLAGGNSAGLIGDKIKGSRIRVLFVAGIVLISSFMLLYPHLLTVIIAQILFYSGLKTLNIVLNKYLHQVASSNIRSGVSSIVSTAGTLAFIPVAFIFGLVSDRAGVFNAAWITVAVAAISVVAVYSVIVEKIAPRTRS
jgi:MFS family permease